MIEAILKGKLSREQENMEDIITSIVFGMLKYVPLEAGLLKFLTFSRNINDCKLPNNVFKCDRAIYNFWPFLDNYKQGCEPDVLIEMLGNGIKYLILIEAKYNSGKSNGDEDDEKINDQLAREYVNLDILAKERKAKPILIYLTKDVYSPKNEIIESIKKIKENTKDINEPNIFWLSWRHISEIESAGEIMIDLIDLVKNRLRLFFFHGFSVKKIEQINNWNFKEKYNWSINQKFHLSNKFKTYDK